MPSVGSELPIETTTFAVGCVRRKTRNVAVPPASVVCGSEVRSTMTAAESLSMFSSVTLLAVMLKLP